MAALPFIFSTNELHVISPATLQGGQHPPTIQITKLYSNEHVEELRQEFERVKALGSATAEEWIKGLDGRGKERRNDAARWDRWETSAGVMLMRKLGRVEDRNLERQHFSDNGIPGIPPSAVNGNGQFYQKVNLQPQVAPLPSTQSSQLPKLSQNAFRK